MYYSEEEVIQYIQENDVRFIKLFFTDFYGAIKSISIQPTELGKAFSQGISFDASAVNGFMGVTKSDLFIVPDPTTLCVLPWRPQQGRVVRFFCHIRHMDGTPFVADTRKMLANLVNEQRKKGLEFKIGTACEFYLFKCDEKGDPTTIPYDNAGYCDLAPRDKGENVRREICLTLEQMGVPPECSYHEKGPGQNEVDFRYDDALNAADNLQTFKIVVKTIAARNGLFASFLPKPLANKAGNGLHISISIYKSGKNLVEEGEKSEEYKSFLAGILARAKEMAPFLNPLPNSYSRLGEYEAPGYISWSHENKGQFIRIPAATGDTARIELRSPDTAGNPYLDIYLILCAGLEGIEKKLVLPPEVDIDFYRASADQLRDMESLPHSLAEAVKYAQKGDFIKKYLPNEVVDFFNSPENHVSDPEFGEF